MLFNSLEFTIFLPIVFLLYWLLARSVKQQNLLLLVASYIFYAWWDWRFLALLWFSSCVDYYVGLALSRSTRLLNRRLLLGTSIFVNIGLLLFFKYVNFFADSFVDAFTLLGRSFEVQRLYIILPVGISFYTFQTLSYTIDVYRNKMKATNDMLSFFVYVSFFPQLVAGPIERAKQLLPQFFSKRTFSYTHSVDGMRQILWGLFKKVVIADNCAYFATLIFQNYSDLNGSTLLLGALFFTFQIYGDFSGYSDIAIGVARLFGFDLMQNFAFPYFSRDIAEFWRRWHISLSTWFRDYLYIPLGGSRGSLLQVIRNIFIVFLVSGLWHGANWTFVFWGFLHACYMLPLILFKKNRTHLNVVAQGRLLPSWKELIQMAVCFFLCVVAWVVFRSENISMAFQYLQEMSSPSLLELPHHFGGYPALRTAIIIIVFMIIEWIGRENQYGIEQLGMHWQPLFRYFLYLTIIVSIFWFSTEPQQFIYFQF